MTDRDGRAATYPTKNSGDTRGVSEDEPERQPRGQGDSSSC
jgi:hypothetical protein